MDNLLLNFDKPTPTKDLGLNTSVDLNCSLDARQDNARMLAAGVTGRDDDAASGVGGDATRGREPETTLGRTPQPPQSPAVVTEHSAATPQQVGEESSSSSLAMTSSEKQEWSVTLYDVDSHGTVSEEDLARLVTMLYKAAGKCITHDEAPGDSGGGGGACSKKIKLRLSVAPDSLKVNSGGVGEGGEHVQVWHCDQPSEASSKPPLLTAEVTGRECEGARTTAAAARRNASGFRQALREMRNSNKENEAETALRQSSVPKDYRSQAAERFAHRKRSKKRTAFSLSPPTTLITSLGTSGVSSGAAAGARAAGENKDRRQYYEHHLTGLETPRRDESGGAHDETEAGRHKQASLSPSRRSTDAAPIDTEHTLLMNNLNVSSGCGDGGAAAATKQCLTKVSHKLGLLSEKAEGDKERNSPKKSPHSSSPAKQPFAGPAVDCAGVYGETDTGGGVTNADHFAQDSMREYHVHVNGPTYRHYQHSYAGKRGRVLPNPAIVYHLKQQHQQQQQREMHLENENGVWLRIEDEARGISEQQNDCGSSPKPDAAAKPKQQQQQHRHSRHSNKARKQQLTIRELLEHAKHVGIDNPAASFDESFLDSDLEDIYAMRYQGQNARASVSAPATDKKRSPPAVYRVLTEARSSSSVDAGEIHLGEKLPTQSARTPRRADRKSPKRPFSGHRLVRAAPATASQRESQDNTEHADWHDNNMADCEVIFTDIVEDDLFVPPSPIACEGNGVVSMHYLRRHKDREENYMRAMRQVAAWIEQQPAATSGDKAHSKKSPKQQQSQAKKESKVKAGGSGGALKSQTPNKHSKEATKKDSKPVATVPAVQAQQSAHAPEGAHVLRHEHRHVHEHHHYYHFYHYYET